MRRARVRFHLFRLEVGYQGLDQGIEVPLHHRRELVDGEADAVVRHPALGEIVGADLLRAVARAHHAAALGRELGLSLLALYLEQALSQFPRLLSLQDRNQFSPTYGSFNRLYWLDKALDFPAGAVLLTGTSVIPAPEFTLRSGDTVRILITGLGELVNAVEMA